MKKLSPFRYFKTSPEVHSPRRDGVSPISAVAAGRRSAFRAGDRCLHAILYNYSDGFSWFLFGSDNRLRYDIAGTLRNGTWGYIVGTYDKDVGANKQRL